MDKTNGQQQCANEFTEQGESDNGYQRADQLLVTGFGKCGEQPLLAQAEPFAQGVSDDVKSLASSLMAPYVGANAGFEAVSWLADASRVASVALIALRRGTEPQAFGLMVLASPDPQRFHAGMGTDFLERMAELGSAALTRLR